jgi:signal transduction histidine kinase/DNA-binding response OmpR family regulator
MVGRGIIKTQKIAMAAALLASLFFRPMPAAAQQTFSDSRQMVIATTDNSPISMERLLYVAFQRMGHNVDFVCPIVREGYMTANDGTNDGVIAGYPNLDSVYKDLRKVPVPLENINVRVFAREGSEFSINSWGELDGLNVGILENRVYMLERLPRNVRITAKDTNRAVLEGVANGEYDVAVLTERDHETLAEGLRVVHVGRVDYLTDYLYLNKAHEPLIPLIAAALEAMADDGTANRILSALPLPELSLKKTVLHIISSSAEMEREDKFSAALKANFELDTSIEWKTINLDTMSFSRDKQRLNRIAQLLRMDCVSKNVVAVIVSGDLALTFLMEYYYLCFRNVPVLFYGVGPQYYEVVGEHKSHFTGVVDNLEAQEMIEAALSIFPNTRNIYVINDYGTEGARYKATIEAQIRPFMNSHNIEYNMNTDIGSILERIRGLPQDSLVFVGSYFIDAHNQYYTLGEMKRLLERDCGVPVLSLYSTELAYNAIGGKCLDYRASGEAVAGMLRELLDGAQVQDIPVVSGSAPYNRWVFDQIQLDRFAIRANDLPSGTHIINKIPSIWESNPKFAVTFLLLSVVSVIVVALTLAMFLRGRGEGKRLAKLVAEKTREATNASEAKSRFIANMSHEMRTPLNSIIGFSELAMNNALPDETKDYLNKILLNSEVLLQIINDVLDISKIESGKMELEHIPFDLHELFTACRVMIIPNAEAKGVNLFFYAEPSIDKKLLGDPLRLRQVLLNLLSNAVKFTGKGGMVKILATVNGHPNGNITIIFEIKDSGIGISPEQLEKISQPFTQADTATTRQYGGTGLGLAISKNIIGMMGGALKIESMLGVGSKFSFEVTFNTLELTEDASGNQTTSIIGDTVDKSRFSGEILLCEDNQMNQQVLCEHLRRVGIKADVAENGREGFNMVRRRHDKGERPYDLIFMDIHMPIMDGLEASALINELNTGAPIVAMTANVMAHDKELYLRSGMTDYIGKPFRVQELWSCLSKYLTPEKWDAENKAESKQFDEKLKFLLMVNFVKDNKTMRSEIANAISTNNIKLAHRLTHTLKSNAGLLGQDILKKAALEVESFLKDGKNQVTLEALNVLETELNAVLDELAPLAKAVFSEGHRLPETQFLGAAEARELLAGLKPSLERGDPECLKLIPALRGIQGNDLAKKLIRQMEDLEFELAKETLAELELRLGT